MWYPSGRFSNTFLLAVALAPLTYPVSASAQESPWSFVNGVAEGYSVQLVSAVPAPGTQVFPGQTLEFEVTVAYQLSIADTGSVLLVVQDENNKNLAGEQPQQSRVVKRGRGDVTLTQSFVVPPGANEVRLFIPLVPNGVEHTSGEQVIRYPVGHEARSSTIGYPTVAAALAGLRTKPGVEFSEQNGWTIAADKSHFTLWSFAPQGYPAYPAVVKRAAVQTTAGVNMKMDVLCEASKSACDQLMLEFQTLNQRMQGSFQKH
jgi:hypothetical protein